ncbi:hypothetical protein KW798_00700 [Candidatus Parcubacteria bacterium]|nr:hypothetical protein [Candidatus Parcubacteria bacterium]
MFFGSSKPKEKTVLVVDVESGSVGSGLVRLTDDAPKLFGEHRAYTHVPAGRDSKVLLGLIDRAAGDTIAHASEVAARLRQHKSTNELGTVDSVSFFLAPPWGMPNLKEGKPSFFDGLKRVLHNYVDAHLGSIPIHFHTHAGAVVRGMNSLFNAPGYTLLISIHAEVAELILLKDGAVVGHGTMPTGLHSFIRTLRTHADVSDREARSILALGSHDSYDEPLNSAADYFRDSFRSTGEPLFGGYPVGQVYVLAHGAGEADVFARALSHNSLSDLFPGGGTIRVVKPQHFTPYMAAHSENPDLGLILNTLFVA